MWKQRLPFDCTTTRSHYQITAFLAGRSYLVPPSWTTLISPLIACSPSLCSLFCPCPSPGQHPSAPDLLKSAHSRLPCRLCTLLARPGPRAVPSPLGHCNQLLFLVLSILLSREARGTPLRAGKTVFPLDSSPTPSQWAQGPHFLYSSPTLISYLAPILQGLRLSCSDESPSSGFSHGCSLSTAPSQAPPHFLSGYCLLFL